MNSLIQINVPLARFEYWVWVIESNACPKSEGELEKLKPIGILGLKYFDLIFRQSKVGFEQVSNIKSMAKMLDLGRADFTIAIKAAATQLSERTGIRFKSCFKRPFISLNGYMYLNEKYKALAPKLEQAFKPLAEY